MFEIEKNVPFIERKRTVYPLGSMKVRESFWVPCEDLTAASRVRAAAYRHGKDHGWKFQTRAVEKDGIDGIRVWRVK